MGLGLLEAVNYYTIYTWDQEFAFEYPLLLGLSTTDRSLARPRGEGCLAYRMSCLPPPSRLRNALHRGPDCLTFNTSEPCLVARRQTAGKHTPHAARIRTSTFTPRNTLRVQPPPIAPLPPKRSPSPSRIPRANRVPFPIVGSQVSDDDCLARFYLDTLDSRDRYALAPQDTAEDLATDNPQESRTPGTSKYWR